MCHVRDDVSEGFARARRLAHARKGGSLCQYICGQYRSGQYRSGQYRSDVPGQKRARKFAHAGKGVHELYYSEVEKTASQSQKTADLRKQLEAEERTQRQLEKRIAALKRKNRKSNAAFANLHDSQFKDDEGEEEARTPKTVKRRKRSMRDDREEDQKVLLCREKW